MVIPLVDPLIIATVFAQATGPSGPTWNPWWLLPAILTALVGLLTIWANRQSKSREAFQRDRELALSREQADLSKVKVVLDAYEEQIAGLQQANKELSTDLLSTQRELLVHEATIGQLELKLERLKGDLEDCLGGKG